MDINSIELICQLTAKYKLLDWIDPKKLTWKGLSQNPHPAAMEMIEENLDKADWWHLSSNPSAEYIIRRNLDKVDWYQASENKAIIDLLINRINNNEDIDWQSFITLPGAYEIIKKDFMNTKNINGFYSNPAMIKSIEYLVENDIHNVDWYQLCLNPAALELLDKYQDQINYRAYIHNSAVIADEKLFDKVINKLIIDREINEFDWIHLSTVLPKSLLYKYINDIYMNEASSNPHAIDLLKEIYNCNEKICWDGLSSNPAIFRDASNELKYKLLPILSIKYESKYKLLEWIDPKNLEWDGLCRNTHPAAMKIIEENLDELDYVDWVVLSRNPSAEHILRGNLDKIYWPSASENPAILDLLLERLDLLDWQVFAGQTKAYDVLKNELSFIKKFYYFYSNPSMMKFIEKMIEENVNSVDWGGISANPAALELLNKYPDRIKYDHYSRNLTVINNEELMDKLIEEHYEDIDWHYVSGRLPKKLIRKYERELVLWETWGNPNAIKILKKYRDDEINWSYLSANPAIFYEVKDKK